MSLEEAINEYLPNITIEDMLFIEKHHKNQIELLRKSYEEAERLFERYKYEHLSNNYLKMHGKPMRRRR